MKSQYLRKIMATLFSSSCARAPLQRAARGEGTQPAKAGSEPTRAKSALCAATTTQPHRHTSAHTHRRGQKLREKDLVVAQQLFCKRRAPERGARGRPRRALACVAENGDDLCLVERAILGHGLQRLEVAVHLRGRVSGAGALEGARAHEKAKAVHVALLHADDLRQRALAVDLPCTHARRTTVCAPSAWRWR
jgi:hypothetical protein